MAADAVRTRIDMADLDDLAPLSKRLNAATDELNQVLESIQTRLNALALGVEGWLESGTTFQSPATAWVLTTELSEDRTSVPDEEATTGYRTIECVELGYGRHADGWALLVRTVELHKVYDNHDHEWEYDGEPYAVLEVKPLLKAARHLRVQAVDRIPPLIDLLKAEASKVIDSVEKAKKIAQSLK